MYFSEKTSPLPSSTSANWVIDFSSRHTTRTCIIALYYRTHAVRTNGGTKRVTGNLSIFVNTTAYLPHNIFISFFSLLSFLKHGFSFRLLEIGFKWYKRVHFSLNILDATIYIKCLHIETVEHIFKPLYLKNNNNILE